MNANAAPDVLTHREWLVSLASAPQTGTYVDLGCGRGVDLMLAAVKYPSQKLRFIGLDSQQESIEKAGQDVAKIDSRIEFQVHDVNSGLPFETASVDVVYSNNLLECLADREAFVSEIARILKPQGRLVMAHWDWDSQFFDSQDKGRVRRLVSAFADWQQAWMDHSDGWMGRRLWGLFAPGRLFEGSVEARVMVNTEYAEPWYGHARAEDFKALVRRGLASEEDCSRFLREQEEFSDRDKYFYSITGFAYVGRRCA